MTDPDPDLLRSCLATAGTPDATVRVGAQHVVLLHGDVVRRFPRRDPGSVVPSADRCAAAAGLGAPAVLDVVPGPLGVAHVVLRRLAGTPLLMARTGPVAPAVAEALSLLRSTDRWPFPQVGWVELWDRLLRSAVQYRDRLSRPDTMVAAAQAAAATARSAPVTVMHADLASDNLLVAPGGGFSGLVDWDGAILGDPATDTAAVLHVLPAEERERVHDHLPEVARDLERFAVYRATWPLQAELGQAGLMPLPAAGTAH